MEHMIILCSMECPVMIKAVVEEAAALASLGLFIGMVAVWAQVIAAL